MRGGEAPRRPESYQGDTELQGQEEAPVQRTSNFVDTPLINNTKPKYRGQILSHAQKFCQFSLSLNEFMPLTQIQGKVFRTQQRSKDKEVKKTLKQL